MPLRGLWGAGLDPCCHAAAARLSPTVGLPNAVGRAPWAGLTSSAIGGGGRETVFAVATGRAKAAVAVIRLSGVGKGLDAHSPDSTLLALFSFW